LGIALASERSAYRTSLLAQLFCLSLKILVGLVGLPPQRGRRTPIIYTGSSARYSSLWSACLLYPIAELSPDLAHPSPWGQGHETYIHCTVGAFDKVCTRITTCYALVVRCLLKTATYSIKRPTTKTSVFRNDQGPDTCRHGHVVLGILQQFLIVIKYPWL
jgi:hypothetical protein